MSDYSDYSDNEDTISMNNDIPNDDLDSSDDETVIYDINNISTDGLLSGQNIKKKILHYCNYCNKWFSDELIIPDINSGILKCQHCFFWQNYHMTKRKEADTKYSHIGISIVNYVLNCYDDHDGVMCKKHRQECFLCDYKAGIEIDNINNSEILYPTSNIEEQNRCEIEKIFNKIIKKNICISKYINKTIELNI